MTFPVFLNRNIHFCETDGADIFLDAINDRYFHFRGDQVSWFAEIRAAPSLDKLSGDARRFAGRLLAKGILTVDPVEGRAIEGFSGAPARAGTFEAMPSTAGTAGMNRLKNLPAVIYAVLCSWAVWRQRHGSMARVLSAPARWKRKLAVEPDIPLDQIVGRAAIFNAMAPYFLTTQDECLFRSLCLVRYLALFGIAADLVVAVQPSPFGAHAWVEYDGNVLNDHFDNALPYTKILSA